MQTSGIFKKTKPPEMVSLKSLKEPEVLEKPTGSCMNGYCPVLDSYLNFFKPLVLVSWENGNQITFGSGFYFFFKIQRKPALVFFLVYMESAF